MLGHKRAPVKGDAYPSRIAGERKKILDMRNMKDMSCGAAMGGAIYSFYP